MEQTTARDTSGAVADLTVCDREPIHIPGSIQPHGVILIADRKSLTIIRVSENGAEVFTDHTPENLIQKNLSDLLEPIQYDEVTHFMTRELPERTLCRVFDYNVARTGQKWIVSAHKLGELLYLEFEKAQPLELPYSKEALLQAAVGKMRQAQSLKELAAVAAHAIQDLTGFDRVLIYTFLPDDSGHVIGEAITNKAESFLGFRFPESDIPKQARALYRKSPSRSIVDINFTPVPLYPPCTPGDTPDLSFSILRSVSPVHLQYMRNMGMHASSSFSISVGERLIGLVSLHHRTPKALGYEVRNMCEHFVQTFSLEYRHQEEREEATLAHHTRKLLDLVITSLRTSHNVEKGLISQADNLLRLMNAGGLALRLGSKTHLFGQTPEAAKVNRIRAWLKRNEKSRYSTHCLSKDFEPAAEYQDKAAGLLAIPLQPDWKRFIMWFRPEVVQTISWAGKPEKTEKFEKGKLTLHPRNSFSLWQENINGESRLWSEKEKEIAADLLFSHISLLVEYDERVRAEKNLQETTEDLTRTNSELASFAYVASHDLQEPLRAVAGCLQILTKRYDSQLDDRARELIRHAVEGSMRMQNLINDLLAFSRVGTHKIELSDCDMNRAFRLSLRSLDLLIAETDTTIECPQLPTIEGDETLLSLVFQNLIGNAIKFRSEAPPQITIKVREATNQWHLSIADNGIGIDPKYREKIFIIFQRLHTRDQYPGTGIGLAMCKKIIERHNGTIWVEPNTPQGSIFHFLLPRKG